MRTLLTAFSVIAIASSAFAADTAASKDLRLVEAAKARNSAAAVALLQKRIDPNIPEPDGTTALHWRSEEHTSELQSRLHLVCRLLLEKKKKKKKQSRNTMAE